MGLAGGGVHIKMRGWSNISDFEKVFVYLFFASYPFTLRPFGYLLKDFVLLEAGVMGGLSL